MTEWTDSPQCPHCGQVDQDWWDGNVPRHAGDGDKWESNCLSCGKDFHVTMAVSCSFSTSGTLSQNQSQNSTDIERRKSGIANDAATPETAPDEGAH